jgi:hypothetical protein
VWDGPRFSLGFSRFLKQLFQEKEILEELGRVVAASLTSVPAHSIGT